MEPSTKTETDNHESYIENKKTGWQKAVILFNIATVISTSSVVYFGSMLSESADKYKELSVETARAKRSMSELRKSFDENSYAIQAFYKDDSTKKAQLILNKKRIIIRKNKVQSTATDTVLYVDEKEYEDLKKSYHSLGLKN